MNDRIKALTGLTFGGLLVLLAANGKALIEAAASVPALIQAWSSVLPLGVWSTLLACFVAMGAWGFCLHWLPNTKDGRRPHFAAETMALAVAVGVTVGQKWGAPRGELLMAIWMGLAAGFSAPYLGKAIASLVAPSKP